MAAKPKGVVAQSEGDPALEGDVYTVQPVLTPPENEDPIVDSKAGIIAHHLAGLSPERRAKVDALVKKALGEQ